MQNYIEMQNNVPNIITNVIKKKCPPIVLDCKHKNTYISECGVYNNYMNINCSICNIFSTY